MTLSGMLDLEKAPWGHKLVAHKHILFGQHKFFYVSKKLLPTFKDQNISQKKSRVLDFSFKPEGLANAVQYSHVAKIGQSTRRAALCRQAEDPPPSPTSIPNI